LTRDRTGARRQGVLISRTLKHWKELAKVDVLVVDKNRTLTEGKPRLNRCGYLRAHRQSMKNACVECAH